MLVSDQNKMVKPSFSSNGQEFPKHNLGKPNGSKQGLSKLGRAIVVTVLATKNITRVNAVQRTSMQEPPEGEAKKNIRLLQVEFEPFGFSDGQSYEMWVGAKNKGVKLIESGLTEAKCLTLRQSYEQLASLTGAVQAFPYKGEDDWTHFFDVSDRLPTDKYVCLNEDSGKILEMHDRF